MATPLTILERKRDGAELTPTDIDTVIAAFMSGEMADYQMSALLMAIVWRGMSMAETVALTRALLASGRTVDLSAIARPCVDKHSTGGVGDKTTLVAGPLAASFGLVVPKLAGRGLGHTGGTLDKLESIPGFRTGLSPAEFVEIAGRVGVAVSAATDDLAPADRRLYALRDVTGTVGSMPLIVASIMSKKLAVGARAVVLDVKAGDGAFFATVADAQAFALAAVAVGAEFGRRVRAVITGMEQPLGYAIGNALEVREAAATLRGNGPADLVEVSCALVAQMLEAAGMAGAGDGDLVERSRAQLASGAAWPVFERWIRAQGGDPDATEGPGGMADATRVVPVTATAGGYVRRVGALALGRLAMALGAGRQRKEDAIDPAAGIVLHAKVGGRVEAGTPLATLHTNLDGDAAGWIDDVRRAVALTPERVARASTVLDVVGGGTQSGMR